MKFRSVISNIGKPVNASEALLNRTSKWVAEHFGVSRRTAQRWKAGSQQPGKRVGGPEQVMGSADAETRRNVTAKAFREARTLHIGAVQVQGSGDRKPTTRRINKDWSVTPEMREHMNRAADHLEAGNVEAAEQEMNAAVMNRYAGEAERGGRDTTGGLASWLTITDWGAGFDVT